MADFIDLHIHTSASDGTQSCEELLDEIRKKGIGEFAITDHDTIDSIPKMIALLSGNETVAYHSGVEISATLDEQEFHLTTYDFDLDNSGILAFLKNNQAIRRENEIEFIRELSRDNDIDVSEFSSYRSDPGRGGWESLNFLLDKGVVSSMRDYGLLHATRGKRLVFDHPERAIRTVKAANGHICLAHPGGYQDKSIVTRRQLDRWKELGISGIECYSSATGTEAQREFYINYCDENDLYITGGSDYHGGFVNRELGNPRLTTGMLRFW